MKKLLIIAISLLLTTSLFAQPFRIATFPFTGPAVTNTEEGEFLADLFTSEFIPLGYTLVAGTTGLGISAAEGEYRTSGATAEIAEIGKQVAADYVLVGALHTVFGKMSLNVEVIEVESSNIVASGTQMIDSVKALSVVAMEMAINLNSQITNTDAPKEVRGLEDFFTLTWEEVVMRDLEELKRNKWIGRGVWIGGIALAGVGGIVMATVGELPDISNYDGNWTDSSGRPISNESLYYDARNEYLNKQTWGYTLMGIGGIALIGGVVTDIIFSGRENRLLDDLEAKGLYLSASPTIKPDLVSGDMNYGVQLALRYEF